MHRRMSIVTALAMAGAVAFTTTACLSQSSNTGTAGGGGGGGSTPAAGDGQVTIMFGFGNDQTQGFKNSLDAWAKQNNITINYEQSSSFDTLIQTKVAGNTPPDIAATTRISLRGRGSPGNRSRSVPERSTFSSLEKSQRPSATGRSASTGARTAGPPRGPIRVVIVRLPRVQGPKQIDVGGASTGKPWQKTGPP